MAHHPAAERQDRSSLQSKQDERRARPRLQCKGAAEIRVLPVDLTIPGTLLDLSVTGCRIETAAPMPPIENPYVEILLSVSGFKQRLAGVVRHVEGDRRTGIEFIDVTKRKAEQIQEMVAELFLLQKNLLR